ncbi:hypothetical protein MBH78_04445 [Oceanimonas sp. NS1]|nr:hypothetical protein [Oceanimonas sp. NS1]
MHTTGTGHGRGLGFDTFAILQQRQQPEQLLIFHRHGAGQYRLHQPADQGRGTPDRQAIGGGAIV